MLLNDTQSEVKILVYEGLIGSPVIRGVAGQRAINHVGRRPASVKINGIDDSVLLQKVSHLPKTHPVHRHNVTRDGVHTVSYV